MIYWKKGHTYEERILNDKVVGYAVQKRMNCQLRSDRGSSVVHTAELRCSVLSKVENLKLNFG
jgi:hypothetical protein